jgi:signal transduction histidine kinase
MTNFFRSMGGRVFLILVAGIVASASLTWWFAFGERQRTISQFREARAIEQAEQFIVTLEAIPAAGRPGFLATTRRFGLKVEMLNEQAVEPGTMEPQAGFAKALNEHLGKEYRVLSVPAQPSDCAARGRYTDGASGPGRGPCEVLRVRLHDTSEIRLTFFPPRGAIPPPRPEFILFLMLFLCSIAALAYLVSRMTMGPLKQLAQAADDLGKNIDHPPLLQKGATEIRQATAAFNAMQARIRDHIRQRTHMLAAITHDLQTPLTRLRLRLEKVSDPELREKLVQDLSQTQALVREGLDLARSIDAVEPMQALDIDSLLDSVCNDAIDAGQSVSLQGKAGTSVMAHPTALRRCLANLVDNAVKYGGSAQITVRTEQVAGTPHVRIAIQDRGPGIPDSELQNVFEPFHRLETSRSRESGGTGLGLTIARNVALQHSGSITLANYGGGLEAVLLLPAKKARPA